MLHKFKLEMPSWITFLWDTLGMAKATGSTKVTRPMAAAGVAAPDGNKNHSLPELFKAITGNTIVDHHRAGKDAANTVPLAEHPAFWNRRLNKAGGLRRAAEEVAAKNESIAAAAKSECWVSRFF